MPSWNQSKPIETPRIWVVKIKLCQVYLVSHWFGSTFPVNVQGAWVHEHLQAYVSYCQKFDGKQHKTWKLGSVKKAWMTVNKSWKDIFRRERPFLGVKDHYPKITRKSAQNRIDMVFIDFIWLCPRWNVADRSIMEYYWLWNWSWRHGCKTKYNGSFVWRSSSFVEKTWFNSPKHEPTTIQQVL